MNPLLKVGDRAVVDLPRYPGVWIVDRVNPSKYVLRVEHEGQAGTYRAVSVAHEHVSAAPSAPASFIAGMVVRWAAEKSNGGLYVVLDGGVEEVTIIVMGGGDSRQWVTRGETLHAVNLDEVLKSPSE